MPHSVVLIHQCSSMSTSVYCQCVNNSTTLFNELTASFACRISAN